MKIKYIGIVSIKIESESFICGILYLAEFGPILVKYELNVFAARKSCYF